MKLCTICRLECKGTFRLPCGHPFHSDCIEPLIKKNSVTCPNCRVTLPYKKHDKHIDESADHDDNEAENTENRNVDDESVDNDDSGNDNIDDDSGNDNIDDDSGNDTDSSDEVVHSALVRFHLSRMSTRQLPPRVRYTIPEEDT